MSEKSHQTWWPSRYEAGVKGGLKANRRFWLEWQEGEMCYEPRWGNQEEEQTQLGNTLSTITEVSGWHCWDIQMVANDTHQIKPSALENRHVFHECVVELSCHEIWCSSISVHAQRKVSTACIEFGKWMKA